MSKNRWDLYESAPTFAQAHADIDAAFAAYEKTVREAGEKIRAAKDVVERVMARHADAGALDSEPQYHMEKRMRRVLLNEVSA
jgi:hypothetical protein